MEKEELKKAVEQELQCLRYYGFVKTREAYDPAKPVYSQLQSIGYTKRVMDLDRRCALVRYTAPNKITKDTQLNDLVQTGDPRNPEINVYTALEIYAMKYPEEHGWLKDCLIK